jgi:hypothetical protein
MKLQYSTSEDEIIASERVGVSFHFPVTISYNKNQLSIFRSLWMVLWSLILYLRTLVWFEHLETIDRKRIPLRNGSRTRRIHVVRLGLNVCWSYCRSLVGFLSSRLSKRWFKQDLVDVVGILLLAARDVVNVASETLISNQALMAIFWDLENLAIPPSSSGKRRSRLCSSKLWHPMAN